MKKILCLMVATLMLFCFAACSSPADAPTPTDTPAPDTTGEVPTEESAFECAVNLYNAGEYNAALSAFKSLESTDEIREYVRKSGYYALADYIFKNGEKGSDYGNIPFFADEYTERDRYFIQIDDLVFSVHPTASGFDNIEIFSYQIISDGYQSALQEYILYVYEQETNFNFTQIAAGVVVCQWSAYIDLASYTKETNIEFEFTYNTVSEPTLSQTEDEINASKRDDCNQMLDEIAIALRRADIGVTLADIGFSSYE